MTGKEGTPPQNTKGAAPAPNICIYPNVSNTRDPQKIHVDEFLHNIRDGAYRVKTDFVRKAYWGSLQAEEAESEAAAKEAAAALTGDTAAEAEAKADREAKAKEKADLAHTTKNHKLGAKVATMSGIFPPGQRSAAV